MDEIKPIQEKSLNEAGQEGDGLKMQQTHDRYRDKALSLLSDEQKKIWKELTGAPFSRFGK